MTLYSALGEVERNGKEVMVGTATFAAGGTVDVSTVFAQVDAVAATLLHTDDSGPEVPTVVNISARVDGSTVEFAAWALEDDSGPTGDLELDTSEASFTYTIIGRRAR